jgi:2-(1,2-epoxy-1,2-dihydrophenyl)acetyl-CoA isomerase
MVSEVATWSEAGLEYTVDNGVAWLRMNKPEKRNAISRPMRNALLAAIQEVTENPDIRAAVITGTGSAFSAGADLTQPGGPLDVPPERQRGAPNTTRDDGLMYGWYRLMEAIWRSEKMFLAAVNGMAAGGGCALALGCDLILAVETAQFWEVFVKRGLPLEGGGAWLLPRLTSLVRAKEIAVFGEPLSAADAERFGLINRCVPAAEFDQTVRDWARRLADGPTVRMGHIKGQLNSSLESTMHETFRQEVTLMAITSQDAGEAMRAYAERRDPKFTGR